MIDLRFDPGKLGLSPPGETIRDILEEFRWTTFQFGQKINMSNEEVGKLLIGEMKITPELAEKLANVLGSTSRFWLALEENYRRLLLLKEEGELE